MKSENELVPDKVESDPIAHYQTLHKSQSNGISNTLYHSYHLTKIMIQKSKYIESKKPLSLLLLPFRRIFSSILRILPLIFFIT